MVRLAQTLAIRKLSSAQVSPTSECLPSDEYARFGSENRTEFAGRATGANFELEDSHRNQFVVGASRRRAAPRSQFAGCGAGAPHVDASSRSFHARWLVQHTFSGGCVAPNTPRTGVSRLQRRPQSGQRSGRGHASAAVCCVCRCSLTPSPSVPLQFASSWRPMPSASYRSGSLTAG